MYVQDTIVAPATPPGAAAVAIVRLSGPRAFEILRAIWRPAAGARINEAKVQVQAAIEASLPEGYFLG